MSYAEVHKAICADLEQVIRSHLERKKIAETRFCRDAGCHVAALKRLKDGTASPETVAKFQKYLVHLLAQETTAPQEAAE